MPISSSNHQPQEYYEEDNYDDGYDQEAGGNQFNHFKVVRASQAPPIDNIEMQQDSSVQHMNRQSNSKSNRGIPMRTQHDDMDHSIPQQGFSRFEQPAKSRLASKDVSPAVDQW